MGGLPLALIPSLNERGCLRPLLALDSGYLRPPLCRSGKSRICHIPRRPRLPSYWAWKSPQGKAGLRAGKTGLPKPPPPTSLELEERVSAGTGGSLHST